MIEDLGIGSSAVALMRELVMIDSTTGSPGEATVVERVAAHFVGCGAATIALRRGQDGAATSLVVTPTHGAGGSEPLLLFSAHADVVPVTDPAAWGSDPFGAAIDGDRVLGRGSSDMKAGLAAAAVAVRRLLEEGRAVGLAVSTGEEAGCLGAPQVNELLAGNQVGAVVVPESTDGRVVLGHRGALWLTVRTAGTAAHGSTPERGRNAVLAMAAVLGRIADLPLRAHSDLGAESVNIGVIAGGSVPNIVPDKCEMKVDHRVVGGGEHLLAWWRSQPEVVDVCVDLDLPAVWTRRDHPWLTALGAPVAREPASYFTDACVLGPALGPDVPVVIWGPGDASLVHAVGESVSIAAVHEVVHRYCDVGRRWGADGA